MRFLDRRRKGVSSIVGSIFFVLIMVVAIGSLVTIFNSFTNYNSAVNKASNAQNQIATTKLSITGETFGAYPPSTTSNYNVVSSPNTCNSQATYPSNRQKLFYVSGMWWEFFTCNSNYQYSSSFDGVTWNPPITIPSLVAGYTVGPYFDVEVSGTTLYLAIAKVGSSDFQFGVGTLTAGGTNSAPGGILSWTSLPAQVATIAASGVAFGPINMAVDAAGNQWVAIVVGASPYAIGVYERLPCSSGTSAANGWEPNACSSSGAPSNYAGTFTGLSANVHTIFEPVPSTVNSQGVVLMYETGSATNPSTGSLTMVTQATLASTTWQTITLTLSGGYVDYSLTSSSALFISNTFYFAGLAGTATGATTGELRFWTLPFTYTSPNIVALNSPANSVEVVIESTTSVAWQAALTSSGTTLALFDNPTSASIQYYTSSLLGASGSWSQAITLESSESAINGLAPADNAMAITWTGAGAAFNIRFAALSTLTVSNSSPFAVHVVDLYVYNSGTNTLVAHWYYNSTEDFDYWVGQGGTMVIPFRFIWTASTSYLVTISTDTGVQAQTTATTLPGTSTACSTGQFLTEISPAQLCSAPSDESPAVSFTSNANTCTDVTSGTALMMGLGATYKTSASSTGGIYVVLTFNVASPAVSGINSKWELAYGTGTAPACNSAATGTLSGEQYTVSTEAAVVLGTSQSVGVTITGLSASTTYWFDVQVVDSTAGGWVYSLPSLSVTDVLTTALTAPQLGYSSNTNTCTISFAGTEMGGLAATYTTGGTSFDGNLYLTLSMGVQSPATSGINSQWRIAYGTGTAPACDAASTGTTVGDQYEVSTEAAVALQMGQSESVVIPNLASSTTYWFDVQVTDSSAASWIYTNPTLAVAQMPGAESLSPNVGFNFSANSCGRNTAANGMAGFGATYTTLSSSTGSIFAALTFKVASPATASLNSKWQVVYGTGAPPACNAAATGTTVGNQYTIDTEAAVVGGMGQTIGFVLTGLTRGTQYWFDVQATDSTTGVWTYSNPALAVMDIMPPDFVHSNTEFSSNTNTCSPITTTTEMMGFSRVSGAVSNDMQYTTTSYGSGNIQVDLTFNIVDATTAGDTSTWNWVYGTGTPPTASICAAASTGTVIGNTYTQAVGTPGGARNAEIVESVSASLVGLSPGTTYWFDLRVTDGGTTGTDAWTYANPQISVVELP